ncbi:hypothetical protein SAMN04487990_1111, partial [Bizionia paragorgiae]
MFTMDVLYSTEHTLSRLCDNFRFFLCSIKINRISVIGLPIFFLYLFSVSLNANNSNPPINDLPSPEIVHHEEHLSFLNHNKTPNLITDIELPELSVSHTYCCSGSQVTLSINGNLNGNMFWYIYKDSCGSNLVGITSGNSYLLTVYSTTTYYVSAGQSTSSNCANITVNVNSSQTQPTTACYETATFDDASCSWVVTGDQPDEPTTACYETATFDDASCSWVVTGTQPTCPATACYETATFDDATCSWIITGTQPDEPTTACYETATFDDASCSWVVTGTQPDEPTTACYETATFDDASCSWVVTGTQPDEPTTACYETA